MEECQGDRDGHTFRIVHRTPALRHLELHGLNVVQDFNPLIAEAVHWKHLTHLILTCVLLWLLLLSCAECFCVHVSTRHRSQVVVEVVVYVVHHHFFFVICAISFESLLTQHFFIHVLFHQNDSLNSCTPLA